MNTLASTVRNPGEGERRWFCGGGMHTWLATSAQAGGAFLLFEDQLDQGKVTPLHRHPEADETFYVPADQVPCSAPCTETERGTMLALRSDSAEARARAWR